MSKRAAQAPTRLGTLRVINELPFTPRRLFWIEAPAGTQRGGHAHRTCWQFIVPLRGDVRLRRTWFARGAWHTHTLRLTPTRAWSTRPLVWVDLEFLTDGVCAVLASEPYDAADYIYDKRTLRRLSR